MRLDNGLEPAWHTPEAVLLGSLHGHEFPTPQHGTAR
jgi:hypothetical protein